MNWKNSKKRAATLAKTIAVSTFHSDTNPTPGSEQAEPI
jgi:hypothetical protein